MFIGHWGLLFSEPIHVLGTVFCPMLCLFLNDLQELEINPLSVTGTENTFASNLMHAF